MLDSKELLRWQRAEWETRIEVYARIACRICLVVGPVFLGIALVFAFNTGRFLRRCVATTGTIVQLVPVVDHEDNSVTYAALFRYVANDGKTYEIRSGSSPNPPAFLVGKTAPVLYEPGKPMAARLNTFFELWGMASVFTIVGAATLIVGLGIRRFERWLDRKGFSVVPHDAAAAQP